MTVSDEELVRRIAEGDQDAFLMLYDRFAPRVYGLIVKVMGGTGVRGSRGGGNEADDVLQEVMWEAWSKAARYDPTLGSVANWLLLMARSRTIDALRKKRAHADAVHERAERTDDDGRAAALDPAAAPEVANPRLRAALNDLPPEQRSVITLAFLRGLTREEIAASLNIPVGTVKTRIRLGVQRLAEAQPELGTTM